MADAKTFTLTIARVDEQLFRGAAVSATLPGSEGQLTILAGHEPLISLLKEGKIVVRTPDGDKEFEIKKGVLEVSHSHATVLV
jgi:F-type H+-transporting ATPase subunit epsilon